MTGDFAFGFACGFFAFAALIAFGSFIGRFIKVGSHAPD